MKNMKTLEQILEYRNYKQLLDKVDYQNIQNKFNPDIYLFQKWAYKIPSGWYGFSLGNVPFVWAQIIDDVLYEINKVCPDFEIHQIKLKFGGLRFYVNLHCTNKQIIQNVNCTIDQLEQLLFNEYLVY